MSGSVINFKQSGQTTIVGDASAHTVYMNSGAGLFVSNGQDTVACGPVIGGQSVFTAFSNVLAYANTAGGQFSFYNGSGQSTVVGGGGGFSVSGGSGRIAAYGGSQGNTINGGAAGGNTLVGGAGQSLVRGYGANNLLVASSGNATLSTYLNNSNETLFGGSGQMTAVTGDGSNTVVGGTGAMTANIGANTTVFIEDGAAQIHAGLSVSQGAPALIDIVVGFRVGTDQVFDGNRLLTTDFSAGYFATTLSNGVTLAVFPHA